MAALRRNCSLGMVLGMVSVNPPKVRGLAEKAENAMRRMSRRRMIAALGSESRASRSGTRKTLPFTSVRRVISSKGS